MLFELRDMTILLVSITKILKWKQQRVRNNMDMSESSYNTKGTRENYTGTCAGFDWGRVNIVHPQFIGLKYLGHCGHRKREAKIQYNLRA